MKVLHGKRSSYLYAVMIKLCVHFRNLVTYVHASLLTDIEIVADLLQYSC